MNRIAKVLLLLSMVFVLFTLAKDFPPYRFYLVDVVLLPCLVAALVQRLSSPSRSRFRWQRVDSLVALLMAFVSLAFVFSEDLLRSVVTYMDWVRIVAIYFAARVLFQNAVSSRAYLRAFWVSASLLVAIGMIQLGTGSSFGLIGNYFGAGSDQAIAANVAGVGSRARISGTTTNPIIFALWITLFTVLVASDLSARGRSIAFVAVSAIAAVVVLSTLSRGAIAAFAFSFAILVVLNRKQLTRYVLAGMLFGVLSLPVAVVAFEKLALSDLAEMLQARIEQQELLQEDSGRVQVIKMAGELLVEPKVVLVGSGPDNMVLAYMKYVAEVQNNNYRNAQNQRSGVHNVWIKMLVEYGVFAALILLTIWIAAVRRSFRLWKMRDQSRVARVWGATGIAFLIPYLILDCSVYESAMSYHVMIPLFIFLAFIVSKTEDVMSTVKARAPQVAPLRVT